MLKEQDAQYVDINLKDQPVLNAHNMSTDQIRLGIVCFCNDSGLGAQTRRLTQMLRPYRILAIDSSGFSKNKQRNFHWYDNFTGYRVDGFPTDHEIRVFLKGLTHVLCCENPLNFSLFSESQRLGIKSYVQSNYEFCDNLKNSNLPLPTKFLMPSYWKIEEMQERFGEDRVVYLPPPINPNEFKNARDINMPRSGKRSLLHIVGTLAAHDRNGTLDILQALKYCTSDFTLTIRSQHPLPDEYISNDPRLIYKIGNEQNVEDMYKGYDAMILPRRYGGLALTMNEALMSGLPVIMTDISPNNEVLPKEWLVECSKVDEFMARVPIDVHGCNIQKLAEKIDWVVNETWMADKVAAFSLGHEKYSESSLQDLYNSLW